MAVGLARLTNFLISLSDLPLGSKSQPPLPPPIIRPVKAFLKICSKPRLGDVSENVASQLDQLTISRWTS